MSKNPTKTTGKRLLTLLKRGHGTRRCSVMMMAGFTFISGSSNTYPTYGQEIDRKTFQPIGERTPANCILIFTGGALWGKW